MRETFLETPWKWPCARGSWAKPRVRRPSVTDRAIFTKPTCMDFPWALSPHQGLSTWSGPRAAGDGRAFRSQGLPQDRGCTTLYSMEDTSRLRIAARCIEVRMTRKPFTRAIRVLTSPAVQWQENRVGDRRRLHHFLYQS